MINMSMRQHHGVQLARFAMKPLVPGSSVFVASLKQPAIQQQPHGVRFDQMLAASDFAGPAKKSDFHNCVFALEAAR